MVACSNSAVFCRGHTLHTRCYSFAWRGGISSHDCLLQALNPGPPAHKCPGIGTAKNLTNWASQTDKMISSYSAFKFGSFHCTYLLLYVIVDLLFLDLCQHLIYQIKNNKSWQCLTILCALFIIGYPQPSKPVSLPGSYCLYLLTDVKLIQSMNKKCCFSLQIQKVVVPF